MSQPNLLFCMHFRQLRKHQAMGLVQTVDEGNWRNFGRFLVFFVSFATVLPAFFREGHVFSFEVTKFFDMQ